MAIRNTTMLLGLFFVAFGSIYSDSVIGAEPPGQGDRATGANVVTAPQPGGGVTSEDRNAAATAASDAAPQDDVAGDLEADAGTSAGDEPIAPVDDGGREPDLPDGQQVEVGSFGQIDLHVKDLDLTKVLQLLSIQSRRNIVASRQVSGTISADLYDVGFYEALDAILHTNGFGYREKGNFIYVYTQQEIDQMEQAQRQKATKVVRLNYIRATDASSFVSPMLSSSGTISVSGEVRDGMQPSLTDGGANTFAHSEMLVIRDYPENIEQIEVVIRELDERPKQVQIEATILEARLTDANTFGVDFAIFGDIPGTDFTSPLNAFNDLITGTVSQEGGVGISNPGHLGLEDPSLKIGIMNNDAAVFIRALDSVTDSTVLARPQMLVLNRQRAELLVGERLGYLSTTDTDFSSTQTVEFLDVGTQLTVRPFVSDDGFVRLELKPQVSDGNTDRVEGGVVIPRQTTQELTTNVIVQSGQTIVLGGLFKEDTNIQRRQVPVLGDIPVLGAAFRSQGDNLRRSEVIFLIKPTVIRDESLIAAGERAEETIEWRQFGMREGLLPWSRTKLTGSHLRSAYQYKRAGETDKALWHTDMVLQIHPTNIEGLRLKEQLTGQRMLVEDHSVLQEAVDAMVDEQAPEKQDDEAREDVNNDADKNREDDAENASDRQGHVDHHTDPAADADPGDRDEVSDVPPQAPEVVRPASELHDASSASDASDPSASESNASEAGASEADVPKPEDSQSHHDDDDMAAIMEAAMESILEEPHHE